MRIGIFNKKRGFTLVELLVVVAILGILATIMIINVSGARDKAKVAKAKDDLEGIFKAVQMLAYDTGQYPAHISASECYKDPETYLNTTTAGLQSTDGNFPNWKGPYLSPVPKDPWGQYYYFDGDFSGCYASEGCSDALGKEVTVIHSAGPNNTREYGTAGNLSDDIVKIVCAKT